MHKKVAFHNLGCKVNSYELEYVQQRFAENDFEVVPFNQKADIFVINTCTVTNIADRKSRQMLHRARKFNKNAVIVAMGCFAQINPDAVMNDDDIDIIIGNNEKSRAYEIITGYLKSHTGKAVPEDISKISEYDDFKLSFTTEHTRVYIKIEDGCNMFCSYCAIPLARGRVRSRNIESIVREIGGLVKKGYKEFVLTGINLSAYGTDTNDELIDVIEKVSKIDGVMRIRLGSLEPGIITENFLQRLVKSEKICPHFHLSMQSGSDTVLKRMNRHYTASEFYEKVKLIRKYFEHPAITTDIIVGFPGETDSEFGETREFLNKCDIYEAHIFKYSRRKGTKADSLPNQLTVKEKSARSDILINDSKIRAERFRSYYTGKTVDVLFEEMIAIGNKQYLTGYTGEYVKVLYESSDESMLNTVTPVIINDNCLQ